jgi:uncharacterized hydrophobic protein (TIGR00271 family)
MPEENKKEPEFLEKDAKKPDSKLEEKGKILKVKASDKFKTVDELFEQSQPSSVYYTLLVLSIFIVTSGLLLNNAPIVIGGMLVTPLLTPILVISLSITAAEPKALKSPILLVLKSTAITIGIAGILTLAFGLTEVEQVFINDLRTAILYFIVAASAGVAATFAWVRKQVSDILPGVSIAVALVPPLCLIGINLGALDFEASRYYLLIYVLNLVGIIVGSLVIFSLLKFQKSGWELKRKLKEAEEVKQYQEAEKKAQKAMKKMDQVKKNVAKAVEMEEKQKESGE